MSRRVLGLIALLMVQPVVVEAAAAKAASNCWLTGTTGSGTTASKQFAVNVGANSLMTAVAYCSSSAVRTFTFDDTHNTWATDIQGYDNNGQSLGIGSAIEDTGGVARTVTVTSSSTCANGIQVAICEWTGTATSTPFMDGKATPFTTGDPANPGTANIVTSTCGIFVGSEVNETASAGTTPTDQSAMNRYTPNGVWDVNDAGATTNIAAGTYSYNVTLSQSANGMVIAAAYKAASCAGGAPNFQPTYPLPLSPLGGPM